MDQFLTEVAKQMNDATSNASKTETDDESGVHNSFFSEPPKWENSTVLPVRFKPEQDFEDDSNAKQEGNDDRNSTRTETDGNCSDSSDKNVDENSEKPESSNDDPDKRKNDSQASALHDDTILRTLSKPESSNDDSDDITYSKPELPTDHSDEIIVPNGTVLLTKRPETAMATATATTKVIKWSGFKTMKSFIRRSWVGNKFCETTQKAKRPTLLNLHLVAKMYFPRVEPAQEISYQRFTESVWQHRSSEM
jgi:hypothetical protein